MTINQRKTILNNFFRRCKHNGWAVTHELLEKYFKDEVNRVMAEIIAVRKHTNTVCGKVGLKECTKIMLEAMDKIENLPHLLSIRKMQDREQAEFNSKELSSMEGIEV